VERNAQLEEKNIFILFLRIWEEVCDEQFFWDQRTFEDKITKITKRYLNEISGIPLTDLYKTFESKTIDEEAVQGILVNVYRTEEESSLEMILNEIIIEQL
jgi:predicted transcriptional regulator